MSTFHIIPQDTPYPWAGVLQAMCGASLNWEESNFVRLNSHLNFQNPHLCQTCRNRVLGVPTLGETTELLLHTVRPLVGEEVYPEVVELVRRLIILSQVEFLGDQRNGSFTDGTGEAFLQACIGTIINRTSPREGGPHA